jgi:ADP-ribose pyrophosphatase YjhB (NUDIX family)
MIDESLYRRIVQVLPILCVDVVLRVRGKGVLLVKRGQEPLAGAWWVVGGRVLHGESATEAALRKVRAEVGIEIEADALSFLGYYEDKFDVSSFGPGLYHTLSLVFETVLDEVPPVALDPTSTAWTLADRLPDRLVIVPGSPGQSRSSNL